MFVKMFNVLYQRVYIIYDHNVILYIKLCIIVCVIFMKNYYY